MGSKRRGLEGDAKERGEEKEGRGKEGMKKGWVY